VFDIELIGPPEGEGERLFNWGRITLGHFREEFQAPLYEWAPGDYVAQWLESAERLVAGAPVVVFVTHMMRPDAEYHLGWPAWREGDRIFVQERLFLPEQLGGPFDLVHPETHAGPRQERSPEGERISQWQVRVEDLAAFVERRGPSGTPP
jgi:CdiI N-terminal domain